ncbi:ribosome recycling factor [Erysipelotrichaceae bacterium OH741_COT-311]|nr:ribosome recycling factor [Erysipelotrichaceae bacterium]MDO5085538.1 ribosome recycling factor [Erysipelotrichaceae bacterium]RRC93129.1 ribosome recycling factor [Erysipelotrichaceae bacterium OH741_COT-311]
MKQFLDLCAEKMQKVTEQFSEHLNTVRTGRANPGLLNDIEVDYYGMMTPINQLSSITVSEGKTLVIKPFDSQSLKDIEKAINASNLGLPPQSDGTVIRITVPSLTEETRKELVKKVNKHAEEAKVAIRNVRRDVNELVKKDDTLTEDLEKDCLDKIQKETDKFIAKVDEIAKAKDAEIMTI